MKYELLPKDVLDEVYGALNEAKKLLVLPRNNSDQARTWVTRAQQTLERNRRQCKRQTRG